MRKNKFEMMASKSFGEFIPEVESSINFADDFLAGIILKKSCAMVILTIIISDMAIRWGVISNFEKMCYGSS